MHALHVEVRLRGGMGGSLPPGQAPPWNYERDVLLPCTTAMYYFHVLLLSATRKKKKYGRIRLRLRYVRYLPTQITKGGTYLPPKTYHLPKYLVVVAKLIPS